MASRSVFLTWVDTSLISLRYATLVLSPPLPRCPERLVRGWREEEEEEGRGLSFAERGRVMLVRGWLDTAWLRRM